MLEFELMGQAVTESVIKRFETCYDCLWKVLRRYLAEELGVSSPPNSPKPVLRLAFENDLLEEPLSRWLKYTNARNDTSHDYNKGKAEDCTELIPDFIDDAIRLYQKMTGEIWKR